MDISRLKSQWDRAAAVVAVVVGLGALFLGWLGVSGKGLPAAQIPYLVSGAVFGLFCLGIAATLWLSADLRDEWRKLDDIYNRMGDTPVPQPEPVQRTEDGATLNGTGVRAVPATRRRPRAPAGDAERG